MNEALGEFVEKLEHMCRSEGISVDRWPGSRHRSLSIVQLVGAHGHALAYIKVRNNAKGFWGLNPNQVRAMQKSKLPWCLILLHGTDQTGFFVGSEVAENAMGGDWRPGHDAEFKVNENAVQSLAQNEPYPALQNRVIGLVPAAG